MQAELWKETNRVRFAAASRLIYEAFYTFNANYLFAVGLLVLAWATQADADNPLLLWIEQEHGYSHLLWTYIFQASGLLLLISARKIGAAGVVFSLPIAILFIFVAQFVAQPDNPTYAGSTPYLTIMLALVGGVNVIFTYFRSFVVQTLKEHSIDLEEDNHALTARIHDLEKQVAEAKADANPANPD